jgi:CRISPR-associated protein Cas1
MSARWNQPMMSYPDFSYKQIAIHFAGGHGERVIFRADNLLIEDKEGAVLFQHSCHRLFALFIVGEVSLTSVAIAKSLAFTFPIILMNRNMRVVAKFNCVAEGNTLLRKKQYAGERNMLIAQTLIAQKISNQAALLHALRHQSHEDKVALSILKNINTRDTLTIRDLMGIEGNASRIFFSTYFRPMNWIRRAPRCKHDIYNLLLDIGYTYLFHFVEALLSLYGFDLFCGVHHTFFYQRKSLVCDIVEPFRCIIDRRIRKAYNLAQINPDDFFFKDGHWSLLYKEQHKYTRLFLKDILTEKKSIFLFCQSYYRWFIRDKPIDQFPVYRIVE